MNWQKWTKENKPDYSKDILYCRLGDEDYSLTQIAFCAGSPYGHGWNFSPTYFAYVDLPTNKSEIDNG